MIYKHWKDYPQSKWRWSSFSPREMASKREGELMVDEDALDKLQALRNKLGRPILITSAYRSKAHNKAVGGAQESLHMQGKAFDIRMDNHDPEEFELAARAVGFTGFGYYPKQGFMHIDTGRSRMWGTAFPKTETKLPPEQPVGKEREDVSESKTVQASAVTIASGAGTAAASISALDGNAQLIVVALAAIIILAGAFIMRERIKAWAAGWR
jgi:zinc D-Ala-D-Ala carboxypeptidase